MEPWGGGALMEEVCHLGTLPQFLYSLSLLIAYGWKCDWPPFCYFSHTLLDCCQCPLCHDRFCPVGTIRQINPFFSHLRFTFFFSGHFLQQEEKVTYTRIIFVLVNLFCFFFPQKENICSLSCFPAPLATNEADTFSCLLIFLLSFLFLRATHDHCPFLY